MSRSRLQLNKLFLNGVILPTNLHHEHDRDAESAQRLRATRHSAHAAGPLPNIAPRITTAAASAPHTSAAAGATRSARASVGNALRIGFGVASVRCEASEQE